MELYILDKTIADDVIRDRRKRGIDLHDEVWDGVYVVSPFASNPHQTVVSRLTRILGAIIEDTGRGVVLPGANVSDYEGQEWKKSHRTPDVVVVLNGSRAVDCGTHWFGGPDFLVEVKSPGDKTDAKMPFYARVGVRELLIIHRDTRRLRLFRNDGSDLVPVRTDDKKWLVSSVVSLAFRHRAAGGKARTEVRRTDEVPGRWVI